MKVKIVKFELDPVKKNQRVEEIVEQSAKRSHVLLQNLEPIQVLDQGFVRLLDVMGDDTSIVQAARISYGRGTKTVLKDNQLIRRLLREQHDGPFEQAEIKFHIRLPIEVMRQLVRHRTANLNEVSGRYSEIIPAKVKTKPTAWRTQSTTDKQGSGEFLPVDVGETLTAQEAALHEHIDRVYAERRRRGVAKEQARKETPVSNYTEIYWKIDLRNLLHFLGLRQDHHAQYEIRQYANTIAYLVSQWVPMTYEAFEDLHPKRGARIFTKKERAILKSALDGDIMRAMLRKEFPTLSEREWQLFWNKVGNLQENETIEPEVSYGEIFNFTNADCEGDSGNH